jgi:ABC-type antimicrobial peptide transport system permease subunit
MHNTESSPPKWADRFIAWYCNPELLEQIQGDIHELYQWRLKDRGIKKAKNAFIWDVLRFCRWRNIKRTNSTQQFNNTAMLKNYFKIGWRNILNQKTYSIINILGLATAIACCLVAYLFIEGVWLRGLYHENKEELYMVTHTNQADNGAQRYGYVSGELATFFTEEFSDVTHAARVGVNNQIIKYRQETFSERVQYVDASFLEMFTYPIIYGSKEVILELDQVIITENLAYKLFGDTHPVGKEIDMMINGQQKIMTIGAVIEPLPSTAMFNFDVLVNYKIKDLAEQSRSDKWAREMWLFLQIPEDSKAAAMSSSLPNLVEKQNEASPNHQYSALQLEPFNNLIKSAWEIEGGVGSYGGMAPQILLISISIFLLTLAIFNYINIAISMATKRIKEIGVRKVIGARRGQLVFQFLSENLLTCLLAIIIGGIISATMFLPWFNELATKNLSLDLLNDHYLWMFFATLLIFITIVSGAYPAFYISSFQPTVIFRGTQTIGSKSKFTAALLIFQFTLAMITMVCGVAFVNTNNYNENRDWGYNNNDKIVVNIPTDQDFTILSQTFSAYPDVVELAGSRHHIGAYTSENQLNHKNETYDINILEVERNYPEMMDLRLMNGQFFNPALESDRSNEIMVNQTFMNWLALDFPTDEIITLDSVKYSIIGVVEDFHYNDFSFSIDPTIIKVMPDEGFNFLTVKVSPGTAHKMATIIKSDWLAHVDGELYDGKEQASIFDMNYMQICGVSQILLFTATLAVILSAIGLFGLLSLNISARIKDVGIRKILGANMPQLSKTIYKKFIWLWIAGCVVGGMLGILASTALLDMVYAYHPRPGTMPLIIAVCVLLGVMFITIASQLFKVKNANPVDTLRLE